MQGFSYVIPRDYGFAPNPFGWCCSLATCKPNIRRGASVGDWVIALGSAKHNLQGSLVCLMKVSEKITFDAYWSDPRFQYKKANMDGSLIQAWGDNIYHQENGAWVQENSHHSLENGQVNEHNLNRDTGVDAVLLSDYFFYFGGNAKFLPTEIFNKIKIVRGFKRISEEDVNELVTFIENEFEAGLVGNPLQFNSFERYDGVS
ncbi:hypothetical protein [Maridesulfovibrio zosterae]|uniref:Nmad2 family putative nucleotide modification protein n=1 Tax=Maridesulfovibrio zosterae TaxID=82171 RepID=UPI0003F5EA05|nr:hypothetical protein [Maridesulfovibrio zosterae]